MTLVSDRDPAINLARPIRRRSTKAEVERRRARLLEIVEAMKPMTVRQVFYQATVRGLVEKSEAGYTKIQTDLVLMRRSGLLPYYWLADNTRWQRKPTTFNGIEEALEATASFYRKSLWTDADAYVEVWLEKDALAGVVYPITSVFDVPLMVARGYASLSFLHNAAEHINELDVPAYIYHLGDYDPSGVNAGEKIEETLRELASDAEINFERIAVTPEQIADWDLPTRPSKPPRETHCGEFHRSAPTASRCGSSPGMPANDRWWSTARPTRVSSICCKAPTSCSTRRVGPGRSNSMPPSRRRPCGCR